MRSVPSASVARRLRTPRDHQPEPTPLRRQPYPALRHQVQRQIHVSGGWVGEGIRQFQVVRQTANIVQDIQHGRLIDKATRPPVLVAGYRKNRFCHVNTLQREQSPPFNPQTAAVHLRRDQPATPMNCLRLWNYKRVPASTAALIQNRHWRKMRPMTELRDLTAFDLDWSI
jgi:hypothetical protein